MPLRSVKLGEKENKHKCESEDEVDKKSDLKTRKRRKVEPTKCFGLMVSPCLSICSYFSFASYPKLTTQY